MSMNATYRNAIADEGASLILYLGLVNGSGVEISGGDYARKAVTWTTASGGTIRPNADITFDVPAGVTVAGWRGYSAATEGTEYGGADFASPETFANAGNLTLLAANTGVLHTASA